MFKQKVFSAIALLSTFFFAAIAHAEQDDDEGVLMVDSVQVPVEQLSFANDSRVYPKLSDFEVRNFVLMSNGRGERWALVTLQNSADGRRVFDGSQLLGLFADGRRVEPAQVKRRFKPKQTLSLTLNFGVSKFPLLSVYARNR